MITWLHLYVGLASARPMDSQAAGVASHPVQASTEAEQAAAALSRFPAGHVPATESVLTAISTLGTSGSREHLSLLTSLEVREEPEVQEASGHAIAELNQRTVDATRQSFSTSSIPSDKNVGDWVRAHESDLARQNGSKLGRNESQMVGYAALVLGGIKAAQVPAADNDEAEARARELDTDAVQALVHHARGAAEGQPESLDAIRAFGVDPERLLLGMSASPKDELVARVDPTAVEVLVREGSERTIAVLMERAASGDTAEKVVAIDALGRMLQKTDLPTTTCHLAVGRLETASRNRDSAAVRDTAISALADAGTVCKK